MAVSSDSSRLDGRTVAAVKAAGILGLNTSSAN